MASRTSPAAGCWKTCRGFCLSGREPRLRDSWPVPPVFPWLARLGEIEPDEMARVFNMGVGLVLVVSPFYAESIAQQLAHEGMPCWTIGQIVEGERRGRVDMKSQPPAIPATLLPHMRNRSPIHG